MAWMLRLIETGADGHGRGIDVLEISRPDTLRDIADLGLTLPEAKQLLARVQQAVVAAQAHDHAAPRAGRGRASVDAALVRPEPLADVPQIPEFIVPTMSHSARLPQPNPLV